MNADRRPNILTIMTDQQRFDSLSCAGNPIVHTPNLDRLASGGVLFASATCAYPLCGPSRACLLSGLYAHGHGFRKNAELDEQGLSEQVETVDEILARNGYRTHYFGKWHTGAAHRGCYTQGVYFAHHLGQYKEYLDERHPFPGPRDGWLVDRYSGREYRPAAVDAMMLRAARDGFDMPHHNEAGEASVPSEASLTAWTVGHAVRFLRSRPQEPFAMTCSILHPHAPLIASRPYFGMYDPAAMPMPSNVRDDCRVRKPSSIPDVLTLSPEGLGTYISLYYGLVKEVDDQVGRLLDELEASGLADNTLVIFVSDHGEMMGSHGTLSKMKLFEESARVPLIMRLPAAIRPGRRLEAATTGVDLAPTILEFAGIEPPPHMHGRSLKGLLTGASGGQDRQFAYGEIAGQRGIRSNEWKLVLNPFLECNLEEPCMLYDLVRDPGEQTNLLSRANRTAVSVEQARRLRERLLAMMEDLRVPAETLRIYSAMEL